MSGRPVVMDVNQGISRAAMESPRLPVPRTFKKLGLFRPSEHIYEVWRPLGGNIWAWHEVGRTGPNIPFNWQQTWLTRVFSVATAEESGFTYSGSNTQISSASATLYYNGRARRLNAVGAYVEYVFTGAGDLSVIFYARENGNHVGVTINGSTDLVSLPSDGSGNKFFDSFANPIIAKSSVQIANALPQGTYTVRLTVLASKNARNTSGNNYFWFNAFGWDSDATGPWLANTKARTWTAGQAVLQHEERFWNGRWYFAAAAGTTGATPPTHTTGTVSDGAVDWTYRTAIFSSSSYGQTSQRLQGAGSQLEYAYNVKPVGTSNNQDIGGAVHGRETQTSFSWRADSNPVTVAVGSWSVANNFTISESLDAFHTEYAAGAVAINKTVLRRAFDVAGVDVWHDHDVQVDADYGWFYSAMWPLVHYNNASGAYKTAVKEWWSPCSGATRPQDWYYNASSPAYQDSTVVMCKDFVVRASGDALLPDGSAGAPSVGASALKFVAWMSVTPESVDFYRRSRTHFSIDINTANRNPSIDPESSMISKARFMRYDGVQQTRLPAGTKISCRARYGLSIESA